MEKLDVIDGTQQLQMALLAAITRHLQNSPGFRQQLEQSLQQQQSTLEAESKNEHALQVFLQLRQTLGL